MGLADLKVGPFVLFEVFGTIYAAFAQDFRGRCAEAIAKMQTKPVVTILNAKGSGPLEVF